MLPYGGGSVDIGTILASCPSAHASTNSARFSSAALPFPGITDLAIASVIAALSRIYSQQCERDYDAPTPTR